MSHFIFLVSFVYLLEEKISGVVLQSSHWYLISGDKPCLVPQCCKCADQQIMVVQILTNRPMYLLSVFNF